MGKPANELSTTLPLYRIDVYKRQIFRSDRCSNSSLVMKSYHPHYVDREFPCVPMEHTGHYSIWTICVIIHQTFRQSTLWDSFNWLLRRIRHWSMRHGDRSIHAYFCLLYTSIIENPAFTTRNIAAASHRIIDFVHSNKLLHRRDFR